MLICLQCIPISQKCDFMAQCVLASDEQMCYQHKVKLYEYNATFPPPAMVNMDRRGLLVIEPLDVSTVPRNRPCPLTHFECPGLTYYCLPVFLRCNGVRDCPGHEDELHCDDYQCPGYYRCRNSRVCVHAEHVCDGLYGQCPQNDDELLCGFTCPPGCQCYGMAFFCNHSVSVGQYPELRYLSAEGSNMTLKDVENSTMLVHLNLALCFLEYAQVPYLPNLFSLDLSDNLLTSLKSDTFTEVENLRELTLAGNPLHIDISIPALTTRKTLKVLDLSRINIPQIDPKKLEELDRLQVLNLSDTNIRQVLGAGFQYVSSLWSLDLHNCPLVLFPRSIFKDLKRLELVRSSNYKLCCLGVLPKEFNLHNCNAPDDLVSSCTALIRSSVYRVVLSVLTALSLLGNLSCFLYWTLTTKHVWPHRYKVFLMHLWLSGFVKGVYLMIIRVADHLFHGTYHFDDLGWRESATCASAGFLSFLSTETSLIFVCLLSLDRFLILHIPFGHLHFSSKSTQVVSLAAWVTAACMSAIPLLPMTSHWEMYSRTALCFPLPVVDEDDMAHAFHLGVFCILNFTLSVFVVIAQTFIGWSVITKTVMMTDCSQQSRDLIIARRLITIGMSGSVCWWPVGVLGMLGLEGFDMNGEVNVLLAVLVLPVSAALNPFLYMFNIMQEHRRKVQELRLLTILSRQRYVKN